MKLGLGLVTLALAAWATLQLLAAPAPAVGGDFSAESAMTVLEELAGDAGPRPLGSPAGAAVRQRIVGRFTDLGFDTEVQSALACRPAWAVCGFVHNVIARQPGSEGQPSVLLTAHYDSVGAGPGISDDLAGVAALLEVARLERDSDGINPLMFVISDGEEVGLLGAEAFTRHPAFQDVGLVVNLEARGTSGQSLLFETSVNNAWLVSAFAQAAPRPVTSSLYYELYKLLPNDTDFSVYREAGLPGLNFAAIGGARHYHTPLDNLDNLSLATLQHHGDNMLAAARAFRNASLIQQIGDAVFMTTVPGTVHQLPANWAYYLALATLVMWFVAAARLHSTGMVSGAGLFQGIVWPLAGLLLAAALGQGVSWLLPQLTGMAVPWWAEPQWAFAAICAAALAALLLAGSIGARQAGFWGSALGVWLVFALGSFLLMEFLPGASAPFMVPAVIMSLLLGFLALSNVRHLSGLLTMAVCLSLFGAAAVWLPMAWNLQLALSLDLGAGVAICIALAALMLLPLLALPGRSWLAAPGLTAGALAAGVVGLVLAARAPQFTEQAPQLVDLLHLEIAQDGVTDSAATLLDAEPFLPVPTGLAQALQLEPQAATPLPWTGWTFHSAAAEPAGLEFPFVTVVNRTADILTLRLESPRSAGQMHLFIPEAAGLQQIVLPDGQLIDYSGWAPAPYRQFSCQGPSCSGLELQLSVSNPGAMEVLVVDQTPGLPASEQQLLAARGNLAVAWQDGDVTMAVNRQTLDW